jgi:preprotein translocase subunit SecF
MIDPMPEQPKTTKLEAVDAIAEIKALLVSGISGLRQDVALLSGQVASQGQRLSNVENTYGGRLAELESARQRASDRAHALSQSVSSSDMTQDAKIAGVIVKVEETHAMANDAKDAIAKIAAAADARSEVLNDLAKTVGGALKSKLAEKIAYAAGGALLAVFSYYARKYGFQ